MMSEEEERPRFVMGGYGRHRRQWVKELTMYSSCIAPVLNCKDNIPCHSKSKTEHVPVTMTTEWVI